MVRSVVSRRISTELSYARSATALTSLIRKYIDVSARDIYKDHEVGVCFPDMSSALSGHLRRRWLSCLSRWSKNLKPAWLSGPSEAVSENTVKPHMLFRDTVLECCMFFCHRMRSVLMSAVQSSSPPLPWQVEEAQEIVSVIYALLSQCKQTLADPERLSETMPVLTCIAETMFWLLHVG